MRYLTAAAVARINQLEVGSNLLADEALLESAVARPRQSVGGEDAYPDIHTKAGALLESLCRNHPFIDGNKRTAVLAVSLFYGLNGRWVRATQEELVQIALDVAEGRLRGAEPIAERLSTLVAELPVIEE